MIKKKKYNEAEQEECKGKIIKEGWTRQEKKDT